MNVLDEVRAQCRLVAETARLVRIHDERIASYALELQTLRPQAPTYDARVHFRGPAEDTVAYTVVLDAINFGSGYFPHLAKQPGLSGYETVARALTDRFEREGPLDAAWLVRATASDCAALFGQTSPDDSIEELMSLFARAWNDLGRDVRRRFDGSFAALVESAGGSAERLVTELAQQPLFRDVAMRRGAAVPFYKRAQIVASDLALALDGRGWGRFGDLDRLTIFADNAVPHVLRIDGVLTYDDELAARIERGDPIAAGSEEEVEIRACAVHAVELISAATHASGHPATPRELDIALWNRGRGERYKARPRHRTRTTAY